MQARYDPEGALQRPAGGSPAPTHTVRLIDLPQYDTDRAPIEKRLTAFLTGLRERRLLLVYFRDLRNGSEGPLLRRLTPRRSFRNCGAGPDCSGTGRFPTRTIFASGAGRTPWSRAGTRPTVWGI